MNDRERDAVLGRLDERTARMDSRMERIDERVNDQDETLDQLDKRVTRNTTILTGLTLGVSAVITATVDKLTALFHI